MIAIDLGSNTAVRSLLFDHDASENNCIAIKKQYFELPRRETASDLIMPISEYLRRLIFQYIKEAGRVPGQTLIGLGGHLTFNEIAAERKIRKRPREVVASSELQAMTNNYLERNRSRVINGVPYALVHLMPFRITVDGYHLEVLGENTRGQALEVSLFATYALDSYWETLWRLRSRWGGLNLSFISDQDAVASALVALAKVREALILKIGAKITEASILGDGVILYTGQVDLGGDNFTQAVAKKLGISPGDAEKIKQQWGFVTLPDKISQAAGETMRSVAEIWLNELVKLLKGQDKFVLPEKVYILGGGARLKVIQDILTSKPWYDPLTFHKTVEVRKLEAQDFAAPIFRNTAPPLSGPEEVGLAALAVRLAARRGRKPAVEEINITNKTSEELIKA